jgi:hypothetical protein
MLGFRRWEFFISQQNCWNHNFFERAGENTVLKIFETKRNNSGFPKFENFGVDLMVSSRTFEGNEIANLAVKRK